MTTDIYKILKENLFQASAPCRIDMGGTLDISTFYFPLRDLSPCTFNIALDYRTLVTLLPYKPGWIKVSSVGFDEASYPLEEARFDQHLGLFFAIAHYFKADGVHIHIDSSSPPQSALGGSSAAAAALIYAFVKLNRFLGKKALTKKKIVLLARDLEACVAGVPCGMQDHLAAVYGGINGWYWHDGIEKNSLFTRRIIFVKKMFKKIETRVALAYVGSTHSSADMNKLWANQFLSGRYRDIWADITKYTRQFVEAFALENFNQAKELMNKETALRIKMTPNVLDDMGVLLVQAAKEHDCGARFTGAGGGGCIWTLGEPDNISKLKKKWAKLLKRKETACLLDFKIDGKGLK